MTSDPGRASEVTTVLDRIRSGDASAREKLAALVYEELRFIASGLMRSERRDHTLGPTALVHEAYARLITSQALDKAANRSYFFAAAANAMRQVLVDHHRWRQAQKRGGGYQRVPLDDVLDAFACRNMDLGGLDDALHELAALNERQCQVITLRFFGGLGIHEIAAQIGVSESTVEKDLCKARAFLHRRLYGD